MIGVTKTVEKDYVAPGKAGYIVREEASQRLLGSAFWGFPFNGKPVTNVRNYKSPFWRSALANPERRCLVPTTEFQEWTVEPDPDTGKKRPHWFNIPSRPIFAFAGIWRPTDAAPVFSFLTCGYSDTGDSEAEAAAAASHIVGRVHPKAVPVILHEEDYDAWLRAGLEEALRVAVPHPSQLMAMR